MGFSLTVEEGKDAGRQYTFDQAEVTIGRTAENDLVLGDPGVSRRHVTIRGESGHYFIQDMGSANGTQLNGTAIAEEELQPGDLIGVGPVVLAFQVMQDANATRIVDPSEFKPPTPQPKALVRRPPSDIEGGRKTTALPVKKPSATGGRNLPEKSEKASGPGSRPKAIAKVPPPGSSQLSVSERARFLRENPGALGKFKLFMIERPPAVRRAIYGGFGLVGVGLIAGVVAIASSGGGPDLTIIDQSKTVFPLSDAPSEQVFGLGDHLAVTTQTKDELHFEFEYSTTIPAVYYLRFESLGVERQGEVDITLNGALVGNVAPGLGDYTKEQKIKLPSKHLKAGIPNELVFDNSFNPPQAEPWAISKVRLEIKPLPSGTDPELMQSAKKYYDLADQRMRMKDIAAQNRYEAWDALGKALLALEAVNDANAKADMFNLVQQSLREVDRDLETICNKIMLGAKKAEELNQGEKALKEYKNGLAWFPSDDHSCRGRLIEKIMEYGEPPP